VQRLPLQALDGRAAIPVVIARPGGCALACFARPFPITRLRYHLVEVDAAAAFFSVRIAAARCAIFRPPEKR
jgi:hypothetical protein